MDHRLFVLNQNSMQHAMAPPEYGSEGRAMYEPTYRQEQAVPQTPSRRPQSSHYAAIAQSTPRQAVGYREDYSRAQHASLEEPLSRASSDVSQEHLRFSEYVNRFASHDPRATPVHANREVSVSERIKRFNSPSEIPPSPQNNAQYRSSLQQQATRSASRYESSYRRQQDLGQDHYRSRSEEPRRRTPSVNRSFNHSSSLEQQQEQSTTRRSVSREQRSRSPTSRTVNTRGDVEMMGRSKSPARSQTGSSSLGSPSRAIEAQRAARSLLAKRRQRRQDQEAKESGGADSSPARGTTSNNRDTQQPKTPSRDSRDYSKTKESGEREEGRTDRILREARSRSMSPRTSRYSRKSMDIRPPSTALNGTPEKPAIATDYRSSKPLALATDYRAGRRTRAAADYQSAPTTPGANRARSYQGASHVAVQEQAPVSPMTPGSPAIPESPPSRSSQRNATARTSGDSITTAETNASSVQELKRQLWDDNEKLQVPVKPSLRAHGYSERRTKQTTGRGAPEVAGRQSARVRSLSPRRRQQVNGHERPATAIGAPSSSAAFNSKFLQAAMASHKEDHSLQNAADTPRTTKSAPLSTAAHHATREYRGEQLPRATGSPGPPVLAAKAETFRTSPVSAEDRNTDSSRGGMSPVPSSAAHSIERVPSSAGVSTATGDASVAKLVAKLSSVSRDNPEKALRMIDSILRAESKSSSGAPESRTGSRAEASSSIAVNQNIDVEAEVKEDDDDDGESESSNTSCDDTSVSSITNPTYQRNEKAYQHAKVVSTSKPGNARPSSLNKYSQPRPSASQDDSRGKSSKAKKEKKPPPPSTINVNKGDSGNGNRKSSRREKDRGESTSRKLRALSTSPSPLNRKQSGSDPMDPAAIALKIRGWDEQLNDRSSSFDTPLSPTRTEDTAATEELGSIITPQSQKQSVTESRRPHPWDDIRSQNGKKFGVLDLTVATGTDFNDIGNDITDDFGFASPWQRRRAAKGETERLEGADNSIGKGNAAVVNEEEKRGRRSHTGSKSPSESPRIAPNVYDVHRKRRSRSRDNGSRPESANALPQRDPPSSTKSDPVINPFDSDYKNPPSSSKSDTSGNPFDSTYKSRPKSTKSDSGNPFDSDYERPHRSSRSSTGNPFDSDYRKPDSSSKSDTGDIFDSAWVALPEDAFPGQASASRSRTRVDFPERASPAFPDNLDVFGAQLNLPPRTPTSRPPFKKEDPPESLPESSRDPSSRDPSDSGGRLRSFLKKKRGSTPKRERPSPQRNGTKPLLSAYAMDSVVDVHDEFKPRRDSSRSPGRRSRTLSPSPRKATKSKSPGRNRLRRRTDSFTTDGEDETASLTGSLAGSTASSVRNKNLAKKFSRFLKVYED